MLLLVLNLNFADGGLNIDLDVKPKVVILIKAIIFILLIKE